MRAAAAALVPLAVMVPAAMAMPAPMPTGTPLAAAGEDAAATVAIGFSAFAPAHLDVLAGDSVRWSNGSSRRHTVTQDGAGSDSGTIYPGDSYTRHLDAPGSFAYVCRLHAGMQGDVGVHEVLLDPPAGEAASGRDFPVSGRSSRPAGTTVTIEADAGAGFAPLARASVGDDGHFTASVIPRTTATYRAVVDGATSPVTTIVVHDRHVGLRIARGARRDVLLVHVTPAAPGATVVLQLRLRDRFGWWPLVQRRLGRDSRTRFVVAPRSGVPARVVLTLADGATVLARSRTRPLVAGDGPRRASALSR